MLRRAQSTASDFEAEATESAPEAERPAPVNAARPIEAMRAEIQRRLAAQIDLGTPDGEPPEVEHIKPRVERRRMETLRAEARRSTTVKPARQTLAGRFTGRGAWRLSPSRLLLVLVALFAGGLAAFLATQHEPPATPIVAAVKQPAAPQIIREARTQVLVAKQAISVGERLSPASVGWGDWPEGAVRPEYISAATTPDGLKEMTGALARFDILPGEPIRKDKLALAGQGYLSAVLASGMRAVSVPIAAVSASGGFILPNDHVDVVASRTADTRTVSQTILTNVRVLAINKRLGDTATAGAPPTQDEVAANTFSDQAIATLELNSTQADMIIGAGATGKLSLVLRSLTDVAKADAGGQSIGDEAIRLTSPFWTSGSTSPPPLR